MLEWLYLQYLTVVSKIMRNLHVRVEIIGLYDRFQYFPLKCPEQ